MNDTIKIIYKVFCKTNIIKKLSYGKLTHILACRRVEATWGTTLPGPRLAADMLTKFRNYDE